MRPPHSPATRIAANATTRAWTDGSAVGTGFGKAWRTGFGKVWWAFHSQRS